MQKKSSKILLVWDSDEKLSLPSNDDVLNWQSYEIVEFDNVFSVQQLIEKNAEYLRSKYLSYIYDLGEVLVNGKRVIDHLELRPGFSYWWMTLLTEKCNFAKSPQIDNIIKIITMYIIRKVNRLWIVETKNSKQIVFTHSDLMTAYEWQFKQLSYA